jgi:predicted amidohydrolase YtcJ
VAPGVSLLLRAVEVDGRTLDVLVVDGRVATIGNEVAEPRDAEVIDGHGGALLPGLHDHHVHLLAIAAAARSVDVSALDERGFAQALRSADQTWPCETWLRVVGYHEAAIGELDRARLDAIVTARPVRVQHATGALWVLNSAGIDAVDLEHAPADRVERDELGRVTGRAYGLDDWLYRRLPREPPDLAPVSRQLTRYGVTGVTDATPYRDARDVRHLRRAVASGTFAPHVVVTGAPAMARNDVAPLVAGPAKVVVDDREPPAIDVLAGAIAVAHERGLPAALHCASRVAIVLTVAAFEQVGARHGDRIEHGAVVPPELFERLRALGVTVVTQPAFVLERGDRYLAEVEPEDVPHLWRCRSLLAAGIPVGLGSDAPHGPLDPWTAIRAATERRTRTGRALGPDECVDAATALARFLARADDPGGPPRRVEVGAPADLCLLSAPLADVLRAPSADAVRTTVVDGVVQYGQRG